MMMMRFLSSLLLALLACAPAWAQKPPQPVYTVQMFGAIADGNSHPLSTRYSSLAKAQSICPEATSLTQEIDWCAVQSAFDRAATLPPISGEQGVSSSGFEIKIPAGSKLYTGSSTLVANNIGITIDGGDELGSAILVGTSGNPWLQFGMSNGMAPQSVTVSSTGQGFVVGETLTLTGGTCSVAPIVQVTGVSDAGSISSTTIANAGNCSVVPTNPLAYTSSGQGVNASINGTFTGSALTSIAFVGTGTGCNNGDTLTLIGGSTPGGSPTATVLTVTNAVGGVIQSGGLSITTPGSYGTPPANPVSTTGSGTCTGALVNLSSFTNRGGSLTLHDLHIVATTPNAYFVQAQTNLNFRSMFWRNLTFDYTGNNNWAKLGDLMGLTSAIFQNIEVLNNLATINSNTVGFILREQNNLLGHYEHRWDHVFLSGGFQTGWDYKLTDAPGFQGLRWSYCAMGQGGTSWLLENSSAKPTSYVSVTIDHSFHQAAQFLNLSTALGVRLTNNDVSAGTNRLTTPPASTDEILFNNVKQAQIMNNNFGVASASIPTVNFVHIIGGGNTVASGNIFSNALNNSGVTATGFVADSTAGGISEGSDLWLTAASATFTPVTDAAAYGRNTWAAANTPGHMLIWGHPAAAAFPAQLSFAVDGGANPIAQAQGGSRWYASPQSVTAFLNPTTGRLYFVPIYLANRMLVKNIGLNVNTVSTGNWSARLGIYTDGGDSQAAAVASIPSTLVPLSDTGNQSYTSATTGSVTIPINGGAGVTLLPGWYWLAFTYTGDATLKVTAATTATGWLNNEVLGAASAAGAINGFTPAVYVTFSYTGVESLPTGSLGTMTYNAVGAPVLAVTASAP